MKDKWTRYEYRKRRTRDKLAQRPDGRPRLSVHRSLKRIYAQIIDDRQGSTLAFACSHAKEFKAEKLGKDLAAAKRVGELIARKALAAGVKKVAFDRGAHIYHGRIKALAEAARAAGLEF
ncbi:MAG: 50S ribosomal protein L18 [Elusimicrobia bacterium]|nr:50S ribosomal protein L18 [Elusimicrobiota bacterium]